MYADPLVPADLQVFVTHTINAMNHWMNTIRNELYDVQIIRILNKPHQNSCRNLNRSLATMEAKIITLHIQQQEIDYDDLSA